MLGTQKQNTRAEIVLLFTTGTNKYYMPSHINHRTWAEVTDNCFNVCLRVCVTGKSLLSMSCYYRNVKRGGIHIAPKRNYANNDHFKDTLQIFLRLSVFNKVRHTKTRWDMKVLNMKWSSLRIMCVPTLDHGQVSYGNKKVYVFFVNFTAC